MTGTDMNTVAHNIVRALRTRLPGTTITNTNFHQVGASSGQTPAAQAASALTSAVDPVTGLISALSTPTQAPTPGAIDPATGLPYGSMLPPPEGFFTQSVGGIPVWGLLIGGVAVLGGAAYMLLGNSKPASAAVKANRRRMKTRSSR